MRSAKPFISAMASWMRGSGMGRVSEGAPARVDVTGSSRNSNKRGIGHVFSFPGTGYIVVFSIVFPVYPGAINGTCPLFVILNYFWVVFLLCIAVNCMQARVVSRWLANEPAVA